MASPVSLTLVNVLYEKRGGVAYVTLNRPKVLNALNTRTWKDLCTAFKDASRRRLGARCHPHAGWDKAFIAGADIGELAIRL